MTKYLKVVTVALWLASIAITVPAATTPVPDLETLRQWYQGAQEDVLKPHEDHTPSPDDLTNTGCKYDENMGINCEFIDAILKQREQLQQDFTGAQEDLLRPYEDHPPV